MFLEIVRILASFLCKLTRCTTKWLPFVTMPYRTQQNYTGTSCDDSIEDIWPPLCNWISHSEIFMFTAMKEHVWGYRFNTD